jgi:hypothetical protein
MFLASRKAAVGICENIFNHQASEQLKRWKYNTLPHKQFEEMNKQLRVEQPDTFAFLSQAKGVSKIV